MIASAADFSRDEEYWYDDGNITIIAQGVGFRIYKGLLAAQSEVFHDLFSLALPTPNPYREDGAVPEDCPVLHVTDSAAEMHSLLEMLLDGRMYMRRFNFEFDDVANCIRFAHKYNIPDVLADALEELKESFPDTLRDNAPSMDAIVAVNLARLTDTLAMLPMLLYECCRLPGDTLVAGRMRPCGLIDHLSPGDLALCFDAKGRLCARTLTLISKLFVSSNLLSDQFNLKCATPKICRASVFSLRAKWTEQALSGCSDLLRDWGRIIRNRNHKLSPKPSDPLCKSCILTLREKADALRAQAHLDLPAILGLAREPEASLKETEDTS